MPSKSRYRSRGRLKARHHCQTGHTSWQRRVTRLSSDHEGAAQSPEPTALAAPSATAISGTELFITDGGYGAAAPNDPELQSATISIAALRTAEH